MGRATKLLAATTAAGLATSLYLFLDNRALRSELADRPTAAPTAPAPDSTAPSAAARTGDAWANPNRSARIPQAVPTDQPTLPPEQKESRLDRRQRRLEEFSAKFGRLDGETAEEYKARVSPVIAAGLTIPR